MLDKPQLQRCHTKDFNYHKLMFDLAHKCQKMFFGALGTFCTMNNYFKILTSKGPTLVYITKVNCEPLGKSPSF